MTSIPILDLTRARRRFEPELAERWRRTLEQNSYILGPEVKELDLNPVFAYPDGAIAVDARIVVAEA